jgi:hypothetical protein
MAALEPQNWRQFVSEWLDLNERIMQLNEWLDSSIILFKSIEFDAEPVPEESEINSFTWNITKSRIIYHGLFNDAFKYIIDCIASIMINELVDMEENCYGHIVVNSPKFGWMNSGKPGLNCKTNKKLDSRIQTAADCRLLIDSYLLLDLLLFNMYVTNNHRRWQQWTVCLNMYNRAQPCRNVL